MKVQTDKEAALLVLGRESLSDIEHLKRESFERRIRSGRALRGGVRLGVQYGK